MNRVAVALIAGLLATACTGGKEPDSRPRPSGPAGGGRLVVAIADDSGVLDPHLASEPSGFALIRATQRGLMAFPASAEPFGEPAAPTPGASLPATVGPRPSVPATPLTEPIPDLAQSVTVSPDGLSYTFRLRPRIAFGPPVLRALDANDVKAGLERALRLGAPVAPVLRSIRGARDFEARAAPGIAGIAATSADTVTIRLERPANDLLWALAHTSASAVPAGTPVAIAPETLASSGPYRVERVRPGEEILLVRNGAWDPGSDPVRRAYVDQIRVIVGTAEGADVVGEGLAGSVGTETRTVPGQCLLLLFLSPSHPRLSEPEVRRGITLAIDRAQLIRDAAVAAPEVLGRPTASLLIAGAAGATGRPIPVADRVRARGLIGSGAAVPMGREASGPDGRGDEAVAAAVATMLADAGMATTPVRPLPPGSIYDRYDARSMPMGIARWCADWPGRNGRPAIGALMATGGAANWSGTSDPTLDRLIELATTERTPGRIAAAWRAAEDRALSLGTVVPLAVLDEGVPISGRLRGFEPHPFFLRGDPTALWLDPRGAPSPAPAVAAGPGTLRYTDRRFR